MNKLLMILLITVLLQATACVTYYPVVRHDNGNHYGWYKNPKNPHHPYHYKGKPRPVTKVKIVKK